MFDCSLNYLIIAVRELLGDPKGVVLFENSSNSVQSPRILAFSSAFSDFKRCSSSFTEGFAGDKLRIVFWFWIMASYSLTFSLSFEF